MATVNYRGEKRYNSQKHSRIKLRCILADSSTNILLMLFYFSFWSDWSTSVIHQKHKCHWSLCFTLHESHKITFGIFLGIFKQTENIKIYKTIRTVSFSIRKSLIIHGNVCFHRKSNLRIFAGRYMQKKKKKRGKD